MELSPYLNFNGNCNEAFKFYEKTLGGRIEALMTHGDSPMKDRVGPEWRDKVMHVRLIVGKFALMGSDAPPDMFAPAQGSSVSLTVDTVSDAERVFAALSAGGTTQMPFQKTFWSPGFGMTVDRFGTPWMVNTNQPA
jgi:PhnB protein